MSVERVKAAGKEVQARYVASKISMSSPPAAIDYQTVKEWADWYFAKLEYQNNATQGWHENRHGLLEGGATEGAAPTRYVEFRCLGSEYGVKDYSKLERCIYDLFTGKVYPNAHYDKGYVEIANVPQSIKGKLLGLTIAAHDAKKRHKATKGMGGSHTDNMKHTFQIA